MNALKSSILLTAMILTLFGCRQDRNPKVPPNFVWITSEDNSVHYMELYHAHGAPTPNIERLAAQGITFEQAFSNAPVCSTARSTLISGCFGPRIGTNYHRKIRIVPMPGTMEMFPVYLRKTGYYTTNNQKEDYNLVKPDNVWDESSRSASWKNRGEGQPFFHVFNITTTHESCLHFTEEQMRSRKTRTQPDSCLVQPNHPQTETFRYTNAFYRDKITEMDGEVGEVISELERDGLLESTFIFYFGDNGGVLPGSKGYLTETGLHVPLVIYIPPAYRKQVRLEPGTRTGGFVSFADFGATVLNLAGIEIPQGMDGTPFLGKNLRAADLKARDEVYSYADRFDEKYDMVRALRKGRYKYVRNYQPFNFDGLMNNYRYRQLAYREWRDLFLSGELNEIQFYFFLPKPPEALFDVEADPFETENLASDPEYAGILADMRTRLDSREREMPDLSFYPEHVLIREAFDNPVEFGRQHKAEINRYIGIANLMLKDFDAARPGLEASLSAADPWERYWGLIVCSSFGDNAGEFFPRAGEIARNDAELINRVRAAEFLGLAGQEDPAEVMCGSLYDVQDPAEALLILNSIVLMRDCRNGYTIDLEPNRIPSRVREDMLVRDRLQYLGLLPAD